MLKLKKLQKDKPATSKSKKLLTVYSSNKSITELIPKSSSIQLKKTNNKSNLHSKHKQGSRKQKGRSSIGRNRLKTSQNYERISMNCVNSNTNSEIEFSHYEDNNKNNVKPYKKLLYIDCDDKALIKQIWMVDKKKQIIQNKAAITIQKVFRGFLTRKLLMKYVEQYEQKLLAEKQKVIQRKISYQSYSKDSFNLQESGMKKHFFPSNRTSNYHYHEQEEDKYQLEMESSIMLNQNDHIISLQEPSEQQFVQRKTSEVQRSIFTQNESIISQQHEISLSFGNQSQFSPHFAHYPLQKKRHEVVSLSPHKDHLKSNISQDKTRDIISQNISNCASYSKPYRSLKQESRSSSILKYDSIQEQAQNKQEINFQKLRSAEKVKWQKVIEFVNSQMKQNLNQQKTKDFMSVILQFSVKNREQLNKNGKFEDPAMITPTTVTNRQQQPQQALKIHPQNSISFKKNKQKLPQQQSRYCKIDQNYLKKKKETKNISQRTSNMKQFFLKTLNLQDQQIDKMIQLRQAILRKKQSYSLLELNSKLENNELSQDDFLSKLNDLLMKFQRQKQDIEQTKGQIYQGYRAQLELVKHTMLDAKFLGYSIPFCRSMQIFPSQSQWRFDELMIDELNELARKRSSTKIYPKIQDQHISDNFLSTQKINEILKSQQKPPVFQQQPKITQQNNDNTEEQKQQQQSQDFVQNQQTDIYDVKNPFSVDVAQYFEDNIVSYYTQNEGLYSQQAFDKKVSHYKRSQSVDIYQQFQIISPQISKQWTRSNPLHQNKDNGQDQPQLKLSRMPKKQVFTVQFSSESQQEEVIYKQKDDKQMDQISSHILTKLFYQVLEDCFSSKKILFSFDFIKKKKKVKPEKIFRQQKIQFLYKTEQMLPPFMDLKDRLNQKMYPNLKQLLVSMRESIECQDETSQVEYYQIGHYQYIFNQSICYDAVQHYIQIYTQRYQKQQATPIESSSPFISSKIIKCITNYQKELKRLQKPVENQRVQTLKIQLHLLLDTWNEEFIKYRQNKSGYSGIGLNQVSLSLNQRVCKPMQTEQQWRKMLVQSRQNIKTIIDNDENNEQILERQCYDFVCYNDSQWIYYTQQSLQFAYDLSLAIQIQLYLQVLKQLHYMFNASQPFEDDINNYYEDRSDEDDEFSDENIELNQVQEKLLEMKISNMNVQADNSESDNSLLD